MMLLCICFSWSIFWTALTAIGTLAMAFVSYKTLCKNDNQVKEMKRQWEEDHRPYIDIVLIDSNANYTTDSRSIFIENYGKGIANNVNIHFDDSFIDGIPCDDLKDYLHKLQTKSYRIIYGRNQSVPFCNILNDSRTNYRINTKVFDYNKKNELIEYLKNPITATVRYSWNGRTYEEIFLLKYNKD